MKSEIRGIKKKYIVTAIAILLFLLSVAFRMYQIKLPIASDRHGFRQTQTAITVQTYLNEGYSALHYQTPVLGSPWEIPLEFPVYQTTLYAFVKVFPQISLDVAGRLVSIGYFYLSVIALLLLLKLFLRKEQCAAVIFTYVFTPFNIYWSRAVLIDYASIAFGLFYSFFFFSWWRSRKSRYLFPTLITGVLAYLCKITSMFPVVILIAGMMLYDFYIQITKLDEQKVFIHKLYLYIKKEWKGFAGLVCISVLPVIPGIAWNTYADYVKSQTTATQFLTTEKLSAWYYGTLGQKLDIANWFVIFERIFSSFFPILILFVLAFIAMVKLKKEQKVFFWMCILCVMCSIFILFNLYFIHDYYLIGLSPFVCTVEGIILWYVLSEKCRNAIWMRFILMCLIIGVISPKHDYIQYLVNPEYPQSTENATSEGRLLAELTERNEYIILADEDWDSRTLYYANRKGFMLVNGVEDLKENIDKVKGENYTTLAAKEDEIVKAVSENWKHLNKVCGWGSWRDIYKFSDDDMLSNCQTDGTTYHPTKDGCDVWLDLTGNGTQKINIVFGQIEKDGELFVTVTDYEGEEKTMRVPVFQKRKEYYVDFKLLSDIKTCQIKYDTRYMKIDEIKGYQETKSLGNAG